MAKIVRTLGMKTSTTHSDVRTLTMVGMLERDLDLHKYRIVRTG